MVRKSVTLVADVERRRLFALMAVYDAIQAAAENSRKFYAGNVYDKDEPPVRLLEELRNQAITLTALAPAVERAPDAMSEQLTRMFLGMFPGLATHLPEEEYKP